MIKDCAHLDMEYVSDKAGIIDWLCKTCGEVIGQFEDCGAGR